MKQSKYQPLQDFFLSGNGQNYKLSFKQIETIINDTLPKSASQYQAWWANEATEITTHSHSKAWTEAGYKTENLDLNNQTVEFRKI